MRIHRELLNGICVEGMHSVVGVIHTQLTSVELCAIARVHGVIGTSLIAEFHEAEAFRAASLPIVHQTNIDDLSGLREEMTNVFFIRLVWQFSHENGRSARLRHYGKLLWKSKKFHLNINRLFNANIIIAATRTSAFKVRSRVSQRSEGYQK
jgi:hypothetical protein